MYIEQETKGEVETGETGGEVWAGETGGEAGETGWEGGEAGAGENGGEEGARESAGARGEGGVTFLEKEIVRTQPFFIDHVIMPAKLFEPFFTS